MIQGHITSEQGKRISRISDAFLYEYQHTWLNVYEEIDVAYRYLAGVQYSSKQRKYYESFRRPTDVFNLLFPQFNSVMGDILVGDRKMRVFPRPSGSPQTAETLQDVLDSYHQDCDFKDQLMTTALAGTCKVGYLTTDWTNEIQLDGSIVTKNVDEYEILYDSRAQHALLDDARYMMRSIWMPTEEILNTWPEHRSKLKAWLDEEYDITNHDGLEQRFSKYLNSTDLIDKEKGRYRVIEFHEMRYEPADVVIDTRTNETEMLSLEGKHRELFLLSNPHLKHIQLPRQKVKYVTTVLPSMAFELEHKKASLQDRTYDLVPFSAYNYAKRVIEYFGIFRNAKGPHDHYNQWRNSMQHTINKSANASWKAKPSGLENPEDLKNFGSEPGFIPLVREGSNIDDVIKEGEPPKMPVAMDRMTSEAGELLQKITGVTPNIMGTQDQAKENASLFAQRVRQGRMSLNIVYHNLDRAKRRIAMKELKLIQMNLTREKFFLITNPSTLDQKEVVVNMQIGDEIMNNLQLGEYSVVIDTLDRDPFAKSMRFIQKTELAEFVVNTWGPLALDPKWWLEDAELGDVSDLIDRINLVIGQMAETEGQQEAMQTLGGLMQLAQQKEQLATAGLPEQGPAQTNQT